MTISRRGLFGTLLGGIAAGYAAKAAPSQFYSGGSVGASFTVEANRFVIGKAGPEAIFGVSDGLFVNGGISTQNLIRAQESLSLMSDDSIVQNLRYLEQRRLLNDAVAAARDRGDTLYSGQVKTVTVTGGCTRDGDEEQAS